MFDRKKCKSDAKALLSSNSKACILSGLVFFGILAVTVIAFYASFLKLTISAAYSGDIMAVMPRICLLYAVFIVVLFLLSVFDIGLFIFYYNIKKGTVKEFKDYWKFIRGKSILVTLYIFVRLLLFVIFFLASYIACMILFSFAAVYSKLLFIPGVICIGLAICLYIVLIQKAIAYGCAEYEYADNPDEKIRVSFKKAVERSKGNKWPIFVLKLSFIGWGLLSCLTAGILLIWLMPYMYLTYINMWDSIKAEKEQKLIEE